MGDKEQGGMLRVVVVLGFTVVVMQLDPPNNVEPPLSWLLIPTATPTNTNPTSATVQKIIPKAVAETFALLKDFIIIDNANREPPTNNDGTN